MRSAFAVSRFRALNFSTLQPVAMNCDLGGIYAAIRPVRTLDSNEIVKLQVADRQKLFLAADLRFGCRVHDDMGIEPSLQYKTVRVQLDNIAVSPGLGFKVWRIGKKPQGDAKGEISNCRVRCFISTAPRLAEVAAPLPCSSPTPGDIPTGCCDSCVQHREGPAAMQHPGDMQIR